MTESTSVLEEALAAIPGRQATKAALARVKAAPQEQAPSDAPRALIERLIETVVAGADLPSDLGRQYVAALDAVRLADAASTARRVLTEMLTEELGDLERDGTDAALAFLHGELAALLAEVREVDAILGPIVDVDSAMHAGGAIAVAWARVTQLAERQEAIRRAQLWLVTHSGVHQGNVLKATAMVQGAGTHRNVADLNPEVDYCFGALRTDAKNQRVVAPPSWPVDDSMGFVRWCVGPDADVWVPSLAEMARVEQDRVRRRSEADRVRATSSDPLAPRMPEGALAARLDLARGAAASADKQGWPRDGYTLAGQR